MTNFSCSINECKTRDGRPFWVLGAVGDNDYIWSLYQEYKDDTNLTVMIGGASYRQGKFERHLQIETFDKDAMVMIRLRVG